MKKLSIGKTAEFIVNTSFPTDVTFQWQHNNMNITGGEKCSEAGVNTSILTIVNISKSDGGNYSCIVTTVFGLKVSSQQAQLKVCKYENCHH